MVVHKVIIVSVHVLYVGFSISLVFGFRVFGVSGFQVFRFSGFQVFGFSGFQVFRFSVFQVFRFFGQDGTLGFSDGTGRDAELDKNLSLSSELDPKVTLTRLLFKETSSLTKESY